MPSPACSPWLHEPPPPQSLYVAATIGARSPSGGFDHATSKSLLVAPPVAADHRDADPSRRSVVDRAPSPAPTHRRSRRHPAACTTSCCVPSSKLRSSARRAGLGRSDRARSWRTRPRSRPQHDRESLPAMRPRRDASCVPNPDVVVCLVVERLASADPRAGRERRVGRDCRGRWLLVDDADLGLVGADVVRAARRARPARPASVADDALHDPRRAGDVERARAIAGCLRTRATRAPLVGAHVLDRHGLDRRALGEQLQRVAAVAAPQRARPAKPS